MRDFKVAFRQYLELEKKYSAHTVLAYLDDIGFFETFLEENLGAPLLDQVEYGQIRSWIVAMSDLGFENVTINRKISSLKAFYKFLMKIKAVEVSPLLKHKSLKTPKKIQIPFSEKELEQVLSAIEYPLGFEGIRDKLIIDLFYATGIRRSELINLKVKDIDSASLKVLGKRNKERIIPILDVIKTQIQAYLLERSQLEVLLDDGFLFLSNKGVKLTESFVYRLINKYFSHVSEKVKRSPHILRHTFATHLLNNGADLNSVKELLGHSSLASTQVYTHSSLAELKKVYGSAHPRGR
ncbi:MAG: tyrosine-type recombinase/integrase [Flavobacterium sp.]|nr:tyrosine-type recombinase/integrase [Flavobacterium sp.]